MNSFDSMRRDLLRVGSLGMAGAALPAVSLAATKNKTATAQPGIFDVRQFGATGDGKTLDTDAVNRAIDAAATGGGGVVLFPAGIYLCFSIHLKSNVHLHLEQGSTIIAADSPRPGQTTGYNGGTYDPAEPNTAWDAYQDYGHNHWHNSLLWGEDIHDFSVTGAGLIWGKGLSFGAGPGNPPVAPRSDFGWGPITAPGTAAPPPESAHPPRGDYPMYQA
jgi:polygalacturonase